jgi:hypothetical protein
MKRLCAVATLLLLVLLPLAAVQAAADDSDTSAYYAVYCDPKGTPSVPDEHPGLVQCSNNGTPKIEKAVKTISDNPNGAHPVTIIQADCYPDPPGSASIVSGHVQCPGGGPNATLVTGSHFAANPHAGGGGDTPISPLSGGRVNASSLPQVSADSDTLSTILEVILGIIGAFALLNVVASGLKYITSAGDSQKISEAKSGVVYALVGLAMAIAAEAIVAFVVKRT